MTAICCLLYHCLSVRLKWIYHCRFALVVYPILRLTQTIFICFIKQLIIASKVCLSNVPVRTVEPRHDKTNKVSVRPAKTQISLGIRPVWSESSLSAWRKLGSLATHWAHSEDSDQSGRMARLIWVFAGRGAHSLCWFCHVVAQC